MKTPNKVYIISEPHAWGGVLRPSWKDVRELQMSWNTEVCFSVITWFLLLKAYSVKTERTIPLPDLQGLIQVIAKYEQALPEW